MDELTKLSSLVTLVTAPTASPKDRLKALKTVTRLVARLDLSAVHSVWPLPQCLVFVRQSLVDPSKSVRAAALRFLRSLIREPDKDTKASYFIELLVTRHVDYFIAICAERLEDNNESERLEAMKVIRALVSTIPIEARSGPESESQKTEPVFSRALVQSVLALAEARESEPFSRVALETLCELMLRVPRLAAECGVPRLLLTALLDSYFAPLHDIITLVLVYLLDDTSGRRYLRPLADVQLLLAPLTETLVEAPKPTPASEGKPAVDTAAAATDGRPPSAEHATTSLVPPKWMEACRAVTALLRWWSGLITLCAHPHGLKSLLLALHCNPAHHSSLTSLHAVLDVLCEVLRIPSVTSSSGPSPLYGGSGGASAGILTTPAATTTEIKKSASVEQLPPTPGSYTSGSKSSSMGLRMVLLTQLLGENLEAASSSEALHAVSSPPLRVRVHRHNLVWNHVATLLLVLIDQGLVDALIELANEMLRRDDSNVSMSPFRLIYSKVTMLLGEVLFISNRLLSPAQCARLQQLATLVERAVMFHTGPRLRPGTTTPFAHNITSLSAGHNGSRRSSGTVRSSSDTNAEATEESSEERERVRERERASSTITFLHKYTSIKQSLYLLHAPNTYLSPSPSSTSSTMSNSAAAGTGTAAAPPLPSARRASVSDTVLPPLRPASATATSSAATTSDYLSLNRRLDRMSEVKRKMDWLMDEETLLVKLKETGVLQYSARDYAHWHLEAILELLEGPLRNPSLLSVALKTKFFARLLSFFKPQKGLFSKLKNSPETTIYARIACQLFEALTDNDLGKSYLREHPLLRHIGDMFAAEIQRNLSGVVDDESPLSRTALLKTLTREYFTLLGVLSRTERGQDVLRHHRLYKYLVKLCDIDGRDDLIHLILTSLDYNKTIPTELELLSSSLVTTSQHSAATSAKDKENSNTSEQTPTLSILCSVLASKSPVVRYLAVRHLRLMLRPDQTWTVDCLVSKLHDPDTKIRTLALSLLDEAIDHRACLEHFIDLIAIPSVASVEKLSRSSFITRTESSLLGTIELQTLQALGPLGTSLLIRCLSCQKGLTKLLQANFVKPQMEQWLADENEQYVVNLERKLQLVLTRPLSRTVYRDPASYAEGEVLVPPHLYGELAKTEEGCKLIHQSGHFVRFVEILNASPNQVTHLKRRASIWAIGHIGASETGFHFLEEHNVLPQLVQLAETSPCFSIRGTCLYVLGMLSSLPRVRDILYSLGWESPADLTAKISLPIDVKQSSFFRMPDYKYEGSLALTPRSNSNSVIYKPTVTKTNAHQKPNIRTELLGLLADLSNAVTADKSLRTLKRLKSNPDYANEFKKASFFWDVLQMISSFHFRLRFRRHILDLFRDVEFAKEAFDFLDSS
jgi:hypothetical protein